MCTEGALSYLGESNLSVNFQFGNVEVHSVVKHLKALSWLGGLKGTNKDVSWEHFPAESSHLDRVPTWTSWGSPLIPER